MSTLNPISSQTLKRLPAYYNYLKALPEDGPLNISATAIARALGLNDVQVRKDLSSVSAGGRPRIGYLVEDLLGDIGLYLGYDNLFSAVLVGVGNLGRALLNYDGFPGHGLDIVAAFDKSPQLIGQSVSGKQVLASEKLEDLCRRMQVRIGILCVPGEEAQAVCETLIKGGVLAIWNFTGAALRVPNNMIIRNEDLSASLRELCEHLIKTAV